MGKSYQYEKMMEVKDKLDDEHGWFYHTHLVSVGDYKRSIRPFEPEQLIQDASLNALKYLRCPVCGKRFLGIKSYSQYKNSRYAFTGAELRCHNCESAFKSDPFIYGCGIYSITANEFGKAYFVNDISELDEYNAHEKDLCALSYRDVHPKLASLENDFSGIFWCALALAFTIILSLVVVAVLEGGMQLSNLPLGIIYVDLTILVLSAITLFTFKIFRRRWERTHSQKFRPRRNTE